MIKSSKKQAFFYGILSSLTLCILLGEFALWALLPGMLLGIIFSIILTKTSGNGKRIFFTSWAFLYYPALVKDMLLSTCKVCISVFKKTPSAVEIILLEQHVSSRESILASNSITLTPGTVTLENSDHTYHVLHLCADEDDTSTIASTFENRMKGRSSC